MLQPYFVTSVVSHHSSFWELIASFSGAIATSLSVFVVVAIYFGQLRKERREAARILLMEIRNAEKTITDIKNSGIVTEMTSLLPVSNWQKFQHLFISDLNQDELILLNDFYNLCAIVQQEIDRMKAHLPVSHEEKIRVTQQIFGRLAERHLKEDNFKQGSEYIKDRDSVLETLNKEELVFQPSLNAVRIRQYVPNVRYVTATTCDQKLKRIAKLN